MTRPTSLGCAVLLTVTSGIALTTSAAAAVTWPPALTISDAGQDATVPQSSVAPDGTITAVWQRFDGSNVRVQSSTRPPGGTWTTPTNLSQTGQTANWAQVATSLDGTATAVWQRYDGTDFRIQAATRPPGGTWSAAATLSHEGFEATEPQVAMTPGGVAIAVWAQFDGVDDRAWASSLAPGGTWTPATAVSPGGQNAETVQVAASAYGSTVVWSRSDGANSRIQAIVRNPEGIWGASADVSLAGSNAIMPQVAAAPDGTATAVWTQYDGLTDRIMTATRAPGGGWSTPAALSEAGYGAADPQVAVGLDGRVAAAWDRSDGANQRVQAAVRAPGGAFTPPVTLSEAGQPAYYPRVTIGPEGTVLAVWERVDGTNNRIQTSTLSPGGTWATAATVSEAGQNAFDSMAEVGLDGTAVLGWHRSDGADARIQATVLDDAFPPPAVVPDTSTIKGKTKITKAKAKYTFSSPTPGATFECRVDKKFKKYVGVSKKKAKKQVPWKACSSPHTVKAKKLQNGKHKLYVRAVFKGHVDPTPSIKKIKVTR